MKKTHASVSQSVLGTVGLSVATSAVCSPLIVTHQSVFGGQLVNPPSNQGGNEQDTGAQFDISSEGSSHSGNRGDSSHSQSSAASFARSSALFGSDEECVLRMSNCSPTDNTCLSAPVFLKVVCTDLRCLNPHNLCTPINPQNGPSSTQSSSGDTGVSGGQSGNNNPTISVVPVFDGSQEGSGTGHGGSSAVEGQSNGNAGNAPQLGCFQTDGQWTTDRNACDTNQRDHFNAGGGNAQASSAQNQQPFVTGTSDTSGGDNSTVSPSASVEIEQDRQDSTLQSGFQSLFHANTSTATQSAATTNLLAAASSALERLQILNSSPLPDDSKAVIADTQAWISDLVTTLSSTQPSDSDVLAQAQAMKSKLKDATDSLTAHLPPVTSRPDSVLQTLDHIFATLPSVFVFLQNQGAPMSTDTAAAYQTALNTYATAKAACLENASQCAQLQDVLTALDQMRTDMTATLTQIGKTGLQDQVDAMLQ